MAVNARTEEFQHIEVFDKPALFTNGRIARDTVPEGWYCYDIRGSDDDPGALCYLPIFAAAFDLTCAYVRLAAAFVWFRGFLQRLSYQHCSSG